ncbi:MAG: phosphate signaling complex protein PhoU [Candidatus Margulisiibacteriota bacterium]|jgi:phosphate transport system protein
MERLFERELSELNRQLAEMAALAEEAIKKAVTSLKEADVTMARTVIDNDQRIDELELEIEKRAIALLAIRQPMAMDLRFITTGMKVNTELERIADLAVSIARRTIELAEQPLLKPLIEIPKLALIAGKMVKEAIDSFISRDEELARQVILADNEADDLKRSIQSELLNDYIAKDSHTAPRAIPLYLVASHLERICDHATNIAEDVIYMVNAKVVKHHPERLT